MAPRTPRKKAPHTQLKEAIEANSPIAILKATRLVLVSDVLPSCENVPEKKAVLAEITKLTVALTSFEGTKQELGEDAIRALELTDALAVTLGGDDE